MGEPRFTSGPWAVSGVRQKVEAGGFKTDSHAVTTDHDVVAYVPYTDRTTALHIEMRANAALIASSPKMFNFIAKRAAEGDEDAAALIASIAG